MTLEIGLKISLITACFNSESTIRHTLESVQAQSYRNVEYIVVDGGSSDRTLSILQDYRNSISTLISGPDKGIYDALNKGIAAATGDYIGFMHSDDTFAHNQVLTRIADNAEGYDAVYGDLDYVSLANPDRVVRHWRSKAFSPMLLKRGWMPAHPTLYMRKALYDEFGGFDLDFKISADYESILRYFSIPGFSALYLPETLVRMKLGGASNGSLKSLVRKTREDYFALRRNNIHFASIAVAWKNISKLRQFVER